MQHILDTRVMLAFHLTLAAVLLALFAYLVSSERRDMSALIEARIALQEEILMELAVRTDRNAATPEVAALVPDCPDREEFDRLLGSLASLSELELARAEQLLATCGRHFSTVKALMVAALAREQAALASYASLYGELHEDSPYRERVRLFGEILEHERERSALLSELVDIQGAIIGSLRAGAGIGSETVQERAARAQDINGSLAALDQDIDALRGRLQESF